MVKLVVDMVKSDVIHYNETTKTIIDTDDIKFAFDDGDGIILLMFHGDKLPEIGIKADFDVFASIICKDTEHLSTAIKITS